VTPPAAPSCRAQPRWRRRRAAVALACTARHLVAAARAPPAGPRGREAGFSRPDGWRWRPPHL